MIPDGRISRVRFEATARYFSLPRAFLQNHELKLWSAYTRQAEVRHAEWPPTWAAVYSGVTRTLLNEQVALRYPQALR